MLHMVSSSYCSYVNCICLAYTWYMWIWQAFLFLVHTISVYQTMFLNETTLLVYPASVTYDGTPLSWQCDWFASWIWFLACIASSLMNATYDETVLTWQSDIDCTFHMVSCSVSNLLKCLLLSYHIIGVNMSSRPFFRTYSILVSWLRLSSE